MAINKAVRYEGRWESSSDEFPMGKPKNRTAEAARDGTYFEKDWLIDYEAFFGAVMNENGSSPNGVSDTATNSQIFEAMIAQNEVVNMLSPNQNFNVVENDGDILPSSTPRTYTVGSSIAKDRLAIYNDLVNATYINGVFSADSGSYYARYRGGDFRDYFYGVKLEDGTITTDGVTVGYLSGSNITIVIVDVAVVGPHKFTGLSMTRGVWPDISNNESLRLTGYGQVFVSDQGGELTQSLPQVQTILNNAVETTTTTLYTGTLASGDSASLSESIRNFHMISVVLGDNSEDSDVKTMPTAALSSSLVVNSYVVDASEGDTQASQFAFPDNTTISLYRTYRDNRLQPDGNTNHAIRRVYGVTRL